jgi:hypothetical protein
MKKFFVFVIFLMLVACSKLGNFEQKKFEYRQECAGDLSVKCRSKLIDLNVVKLEAAIEAIENKKSEIIACKGQQFYDGGIAVIRDRMEYFQDLKPNIFSRLFLSSMDVEFNPPPHRREADFEAFLVGADGCGKDTASAALENTKSSGALDSNADNLPVILHTAAGELERKQMANGQSAMTLNGNQLFSGDDAPWQFPLRSFQLSAGRQAILMASSGGRGNSCETLFFFLIADNTGLKPTPEFGTCSAQGSFSQDGDQITLTLPKMGGNTVYTFDGSAVTEDGNAVVLSDNNNPEN